jgi:hypothetical protein
MGETASRPKNLKTSKKNPREGTISVVRKHDAADMYLATVENLNVSSRMISPASIVRAYKLKVNSISQTRASKDYEKLPQDSPINNLANNNAFDVFFFHLSPPQIPFAKCQNTRPDFPPLPTPHTCIHYPCTRTCFQGYRYQNPHTEAPPTIRNSAACYQTG